MFLSFLACEMGQQQCPPTWLPWGPRAAVRHSAPWPAWPFHQPQGEGGVLSPRPPPPSAQETLAVLQHLRRAWETLGAVRDGDSALGPWDVVPAGPSRPPSPPRRQSLPPAPSEPVASAEGGLTLSPDPPPGGRKSPSKDRTLTKPRCSLTPQTRGNLHPPFRR